MRRGLLILMGAACAFGNMQAQCSGGTSGGSITPGTNYGLLFVNAGVYVEFVATAGISYQFSFCQGGGSASWDTQITILDNNGNFAGGYNDDYCGLSSDLQWSAPLNGTYRILISEFYCQNSGAFALMSYRQLPPPGPGANCANPIVINSLPYAAAGMSTCGAGNDYTSTGTCNTAYMNGEDFVFRYTANAAQNITISLSGTLGSTGIFVVRDCPNTPGALCIPPSGSSNSCTAASASNISYAGNPTATFNLPSAGIYYLIVDTWPSPTCTPFDISVTSAAASVAPTVCYAVSPIFYAPDNFNSGTTINFPDDQFSSLINLPFSFCFMGSSHTSLVISSNAYLSFNTNCAGQYSPWDTEAIPSTSLGGISNSIMGPWVDIDPGVSGTIKYATYGTAPYRRFVVSFRNVAMYSSTCNNLRFTGQISLYETTNIIENHIQTLPNCPSWNNGEAVLGLTDPSGTQAVTDPLHNNAQFSLSNYAIRYTPTCNMCSNAPLPVAFGEIEGRKAENGNLVTFSTRFESRMKSFRLEKSGDATKFSEAGKLACTNASKGSEYAMTDANPFYPVSYYRIAAEDLDGNIEYSPVVAVNGGESGMALLGILSQNQTGNIVLSFDNAGPSSELDLRVTDIRGREIRSQKIQLGSGRTDTNLSMPEGSTGVYLATLSDGKNWRETRKFVVE